jgi:hypothetical protein
MMPRYMSHEEMDAKREQVRRANSARAKAAGAKRRRSAALKCVCKLPMLQYAPKIIREVSGSSKNEGRSDRRVRCIIAGFNKDFVGSNNALDKSTRYFSCDVGCR